MATGRGTLPAGSAPNRASATRSSIRPFCLLDPRDHGRVIDPIVAPGDFARLRQPVVLADVRWYLDGRSGRAAYEEGHLPGARFVDLDADLSDHSQPATEGRHPLPTPEAFAAAMGRLGIADDTTV